MTTEAGPLLVPIDDFGIDTEALALLVETARQLDRSLLVLLLESPRLYGVAELSFSREITLQDAGERDLQSGLLRRLGGRARALAQRQLTERAALARVALRFELREGERLALALAGENGRDSWLSRRPRASIRGAAAAPALGAVLAGIAADTAVVTAASALAARGGYRDLYLHSNQPWPPPALAGLAAPGLRLHRLPEASLDAPALLRLLRRLQNELLIMPRELLRSVDPLDLERALDRSGGQVLLVDGPG